jgi:flagellar hook assembly protein FlgD
MDPTSAVSAASGAAPAGAAKAKTTLASNFDTFLTLLTTQLKNQDPLSPMDSSQFTQQLVQFSQVEQSINANQNLEKLITLTQARAGSDAVNYLGKTVTITDGTAGLKSGQALWGYSLASDSAATRLVRSSLGALSTTRPLAMIFCCSAGSESTLCRSAAIFATISGGTDLVATMPPQPSPENPG